MWMLGMLWILGWCVGDASVSIKGSSVRCHGLCVGRLNCTRVCISPLLV